MGHPGGPIQHGVRVLVSEMRRQTGDPAQVQPTVAEHLEQDRVFPGRPGVQPPELHLTDVGDDLGLDSPRLLHELVQLTQKVLVSDALQAQHGDSLGES